MQKVPNKQLMRRYLKEGKFMCLVSENIEEEVIRKFVI